MLREIIAFLSFKHWGLVLNPRGDYLKNELALFDDLSEWDLKWKVTPIEIEIQLRASWMAVLPVHSAKRHFGGTRLFSLKRKKEKGKGKKTFGGNLAAVRLTVVRASSRFPWLNCVDLVSSKIAFVLSANHSVYQINHYRPTFLSFMSS